MARPASLKKKVYEALRKQIVSGQFAGGTRLTEVAMAASLSVSRTPVREALQRLSQERLIVTIPKAGYMVEDLSDDDIQDLFSTRMAVEAIAVEKAVQNMTVEEFKAMDTNLEKTGAAVKSAAEWQLTELDLEFHTLIYTAARSRSLFRICKNLGDVTLKYRHSLNQSPARQNQILQQHIDIYQAMLSRNADLAIQAMAHHGEKARNHLVTIMKKLRSDRFSTELY